MTQEDKELLLVDLSARLTYRVICQVDDGAAGLNDGKLVEIDISKELVRFDVDYYWDAYVDDVKPYLRPMSSMTEVEKKEYHNLCYEEERECYEFGEWVTRIYFHDTIESIDYLNSIYVDYRSLIPKGLALEAPEGMYKKDNNENINKTS